MLRSNSVVARVIYWSAGPSCRRNEDVSFMAKVQRNTRIDSLRQIDGGIDGSI